MTPFFPKLFVPPFPFRTHLYYIALYKAGDFVIVHAAPDVDCIDPECWRYLGHCWTSKKFLRQVEARLLSAINQEYNRCFLKISVM